MRLIRNVCGTGSKSTDQKRHRDRPCALAADLFSDTDGLLENGIISAEAGKK